MKCCFWFAGKDGRDGVNGDVHFMFLSFSNSILAMGLILVVTAVTYFCNTSLP